MKKRYFSATLLLALFAMLVVSTLSVIILNMGPPAQAEIQKWSRELGDEVLTKMPFDTERITGVYVVTMPQFNAATQMYETIWSYDDPNKSGHVVTGYRPAISTLSPRIENGKMDIVARHFYQDDSQFYTIYFSQTQQ